MIEIIFSTIAPNVCRLKIVGHSGSAKKGEDIICAAVSALAQTFIGGCEAELDAKAEGEMKPGDLDVTVNVLSEKVSELQAVYNVFNFGFRKIAQAYPKHVKMN